MSSLRALQHLTLERTPCQDHHQAVELIVKVIKIWVCWVTKHLVMQARHAAAILEEEYPDTDERKKASAAAREAATPIPERVWALRYQPPVVVNQ